MFPGPVNESDFLEALKTTKPSSMLKTEVYTKWEAEHGSQWLSISFILNNFFILYYKYLLIKILINNFIIYIN